MARRNKETNDLPKAKLTKSSLEKSMRLMSFAGIHKWKLIVGMFFLLLTSVTVLAFPKLLGMLVNTASATSEYSINQIGLALVILIALQSVFSYFRIYLFVNYTEHTLATMRQKVYSHLIKLPMTFFSENRVGELNSRMSADITQIQDTLTTTIAEFIRQVVLIFGGVAILCTISLKLTFLMLGIVPVVAVLAVFFGRYIKKISTEVQSRVADSNTIIEETLQGIVNVKSFANEYFEFLRYHKSTTGIVRVGVVGGMYRGAFASFIVFCLFGSIIAVLWYGVILVSNGDFDEGKLFSFVIYSAFIGVSFGGVADMYAKIQKAVGAVERLFELLDEEPEDIDIKNNNTHLSRFEGNVVFDKVDFTYPSRETMQILKSVSFTAKKGETVAFVGSSGSGKSTIVSLLLRFYEPNNGAVTIDGKNATSCNLSDLRNNMAIVPQEVLLFGGTIKENIAYGKPGASVSEIEEAAKKANAFDFIEGFPEKFETVVGDRGIKLSGGQRQRVAIARAVLKDPSILILDEATSALDSKSEQVVQEALDKLMENRTSFVIAHRLSTIRSADKIVVIEAGEVKEVGSHSELMAIDNGVYKSLSALQSDVIQ